MIETDQKLEVIISEEQLRQRVAELAREVSRDYRMKNPVLLGTLKGSFVFLADLARQLDFDLEIEFIGARSYGNSQQSSGTVDLFKNLSIDIRERHVLIVEDVVDTGLTLRFLIEDLQMVKPLSVDVITLLNKRNARKAAVPLKYIGFQIDDQFVFGYGLDYSEKYRNLPYIAVFKNSEES